MADEYSDLKREIWCLKKAIEAGGGGGGGTSDPFPAGRVANYSSLPAPNTAGFKYYYVQNSQGDPWTPPSEGGNFYPRGFYYSNSLAWTLVADIPYEATQVEVDAGTVDDKFVTPETLANYSQWSTKVSSVTGDTVDNTDPENPVVNAVGGSGTSGRVAFWSGSATVSSDSVLFWDNSNNRLGIGTGVPSSTLHVVGSGNTSATKAVKVDNSDAAQKFAVLNDGTVEIGKNTSYSSVAVLSTQQGNVSLIKPVDVNPIGVILDIPADGFFALSNELDAGYSIPRGKNSLDIQINNAGATGNESIIVGRNASATGSYSIVFGTGSATGLSSYVFGNGAATASNAYVYGQGQAAGENTLVVGYKGSGGQVALGRYSAAIHTMDGFAGGENSLILGGQYSRAIAEHSVIIGGYSTSTNIYGQVITNGRGVNGIGYWTDKTNSCATFNIRMARQFYIASGGPLSYELFTDGSSQKAVLDTKSSWNARLDVIAVVAHDGSGGGFTWGHSWAASYQFSIKRHPSSNTVSLVGTVDTVMSPKFDASMSGCGITISADDTNKCAKVEFTIPSAADVAAQINVVATMYVTQTRYLYS